MSAARGLRRIESIRKPRCKEEVTEGSVAVLTRSLETVRRCIARPVGGGSAMVLPPPRFGGGIEEPRPSRNAALGAREARTKRVELLTQPWFEENRCAEVRAVERLIDGRAA